MNPAWAGRWLGAAAVLWGLGAWYAYDAAIGYPEHNRRAARFQELQAQGRAEQWPALAAELGWEPGEPDPPYGEHEITLQWVIAAGCGLLGLMAALTVAVHARRRIVADARRLCGPQGVEIPYERITSIDRSRWDSKGIAVVRFRSDRGRDRSLKLDAWVFRGAEDVLQEVERRTGLGGDLSA